MFVRDMREPIDRREDAPDTEIRWLSGPGDAVIDSLPPGRREPAREALRLHDRGLVAYVDGSLAGWWWITKRSRRDPVNGVMTRLADDEAFFYDLMIKPEYRRHSVGRTMTDEGLWSLYEDPEVSYALTEIDRDNVPSATFARSYGFEPRQSVKSFRARWGRGIQIPFSERPRVGPFSRRGRHTGHELPSDID